MNSATAIALFVLTVVASAGSNAWAQLVAGKDAPIVYGHHHIYVSDMSTSVVAPGPIDVPKPGFYTPDYSYPRSTEVHRWMVYAIDFKGGKIRWEREVHRGPPAAQKHHKNTCASETPVTDGERVYTYFGGIGLFVFDLAGKLLWSKPSDPLQMRGWGTAASPTVHQNRVYVVNDNDTVSSIAAYDARTGDIIWRVVREENSNWSTPFVWEHDLGTEIVTTGSKKVRSYDLDGKLKWELTGMTSIQIPTPFAKHGLLFISSGYLGDSVRPVYAIRPGGSGDISLKEGETSNRHVAWSQRRLGTYATSGLVYGDHYYGLLDRGFLVCIDARTGKEVYARQRISGEASGFTASPWAYNGRIFALSEDGDTFVVQAGKGHPDCRARPDSVLDSACARGRGCLLGGRRGSEARARA